MSEVSPFRRLQEVLEESAMAYHLVLPPSEQLSQEELGIIAAGCSNSASHKTPPADLAFRSEATASGVWRYG